ncbi:MAG TPA: bifunctional methylenetetrahydrofolate dehydrogenase/methenyltetrahydrofolate cyclohydrolase FolD [Thermoanaerobaculia bacterium]|nr:bifunctional methylenetetrahydrofolate dehydrogenase/methenyltetrahydrofolate cyclohydrolase FolD [Thermoanaerobaculia bacterium]
MTPPADRLLDGRAVATGIRAEVATDVAALVQAGARPPGLAAVLVGDDPASCQYVGMKARACEEVGMVGRTVVLPERTPADELAHRIDELNVDDAIDGILVQLPLPDPLPERDFLARVDPGKDVDGFHPVNVGHLWSDEPGFAPATPSGIIRLLHSYDVPLAGRHAVVVGRSTIVGKPMAALLLREHATVTICHSRTRDLAAVCRGADVLVSAVGRPGLIGADHVAEGAVVVDVGTNRVTDRALAERLFTGDPARLARFDERGSSVVGDVDFAAVRDRVARITPVPGGVGPLTVAMLLVNTLEASRRRQGLVA